MEPSARPPSPTFNRRQFLSGSLAAGAALALLPGCVTRPSRAARRDGKVNLAVVGIGNRGGDLIKTFAGTELVRFVAFCDVDLNGPHTQEARTLYPDVPGFQDFRVMLDRLDAEIDAVVVATPDHAHFPIAMHAMARGKHVFVEKPLAQTFQEVELLMAMARKSGVVTQMGNQGHSGNNYFQFKAWTEAGVIRDVTRIDAFFNERRRWHGWKVDGFPTGEAVPATLDWDLWHAGRPRRPYSRKLHPQEWRGWFEFGDGAFGDWGPHILDTAHRFLDLGLPHTIEAVHREGVSEYIFPQASTIRFDFGARKAMPPIEVFWYDGIGNSPALPPELELGPGKTLVRGKILYCKDIMFRGGTHSETLRVIPESRMRAMARDLPRIGSGFSDHFQNFVLACLGREEARSPFPISGPLTQVFLLGVIAQRLGGRLEFDPVRKRFPRHPQADALLAGAAPQPGWEKFRRV